MPVFAEHALHIMVGWNDTYLANHIHRFDAMPIAAARTNEVAAGAAVGSISYILWFVAILVSAVGTGSTAIISRAIGAKHRSLANSICGQSISLGIIIGLFAGAAMFIFARAHRRRDGPQRRRASVRVSVPAHPRDLDAVLDGDVHGQPLPARRRRHAHAGDHDDRRRHHQHVLQLLDDLRLVRHAAAGLRRHRRGDRDRVRRRRRHPVLRAGRRPRRHPAVPAPHAPHWHNLKRLLRIGIPGGVADMLHWVGNFGVLLLVNQMGPAQGNAATASRSASSASSYMTGFAVATAAATMVGQSLGMRYLHRATRSAYVGYAVGGGIMVTAGIGFILFGNIRPMLFTR